VGARCLTQRFFTARIVFPPKNVIRVSPPFGEEETRGQLTIFKGVPIPPGEFLTHPLRKGPNKRGNISPSDIRPKNCPNFWKVLTRAGGVDYRVSTWNFSRRPPTFNSAEIPTERLSKGFWNSKLALLCGVLYKI